MLITLSILPVKPATFPTAIFLQELSKLSSVYAEIRICSIARASVIEIFGLYAVYGFAYSVAVGYTFKLPAAPLKCLTAKSDGIADFVIGHSLTVKACVTY